MFLREYPWYPNPFSSPQVFVGVTETSDFVLEMLHLGGEVVEAFAFQDIAPGAYHFTFTEAASQTKRRVVRLMLEGEDAGRIEMRTRPAKQPK